ncbi:MAG: OmpA family protein [Pseudomonadota bacterium]
MIKKIAVVALAGTVLAGCQGGGLGGLGNTGTGALLGAGAGAALGTLAGGNDTRNALIGAGIGALAGGAVGYYMDQQEAALQADLAASGAAVTRQGDNLLVSLPAGVTFATDSYDIKPEFYGPLTNVAQTLREYQSSIVNVMGHTDNTGSAAYNQTLSEQRAQAVANFLIQQGVNPARVYSQGFGLTRPVADNSTAAGRAANRRVEIEIIPFTE